jgi:hypothetical protein
MTRLNVSAIARIGCLAATLCFISVAEAKKPDKPPGGPGGDKPVATGHLYYQSNGLWQLAADGSQNTPLGIEFGREPSYALHGGFRWFLNSGGGGSLACGREDGAITVTLVDDPSLNVDIFSMRWVNGSAGPDSSIAFLADEIDVIDGSPTIVGTAIYIATVEFDVDGTPLLSSAPSVLLADMDTGDFDFSLDGSLVVYQQEGLLFIVDLLLPSKPESWLPVSGVEAALPQFSPDGSRIAYRAWDRTGDRKTFSSVNVVELGFENGEFIVAAESTLASETFRKRGSIGGNVIYSGPFWSPDGNFLAYATETSVGYERFYSIMRMRDDGSSQTNLLPDDGGTQSLFLRGWR